MDLRQLRYLVALADERHFTRAAAREHVAQPALSQQIRRLEDEVGLALVERTTRHVAITDAGQLLVARARRMLAELEAAQAELLAVRGMESGRVRVGTMHTMGPIDVSVALAAMLRDDELDLAFLSVTERVESHGLALHQLVLEELVALLPPEHPLAASQPLDIAELAGEEFISFRPGARLRELLFSAARRAGFEPRVKLESNESQRIRRLVARGMGVAILPRSDAVAPGAEVAVVGLSGPPLVRDITLAWRRDRRQPPAVAEFLSLSRRIFQPEAGGGRAHGQPEEAGPSADGQPEAGGADAGGQPETAGARARGGRSPAQGLAASSWAASE